MDDTIKCEMISREIIKPSSPTPQHNRIFSLSWFEQNSSHMFVPILLFFEQPLLDTTLLKTSLSQTLSEYYPFAGRLRDRETVLCSDDGVAFVEARVNAPLAFLLTNPKRESLDSLFVDKLNWGYPAESAFPGLLAVQVTRFGCGGFSVGVCVSHKVADAATLVSFVSAWAAVARDGLAAARVLFPVLDVAAELFPRGGDLPLLPEWTCSRPHGQVTTKRFVFSTEKIGLLRAVPPGGSSRVEAVAALLYGAAMRASKAVSGADTHVLLLQVNLRTRMVPKLPENTVGSLAWFVPVAGAEAGELRETLSKYSEGYFERFRMSHEEWFVAMKECMEESKGLTRGANRFICTSWCRFPMYEVDFGWGNPVWATTSGTADNNILVLCDTKNGDGIEATVTLDHPEMLLFENDHELLQFASPRI